MRAGGACPAMSFLLSTVLLASMDDAGATIGLGCTVDCIAARRAHREPCRCQADPLASGTTINAAASDKTNCHCILSHDRSPEPLACAPLSS